MIFKALFGKKSEDEAPPQSFDSEESAWGDDRDSSPAAAKDPIDDYDEDAEVEESEDDNILREMNLRARAYELYNRRKLKTIEERLTGFDKDIFRVLPALVHLNTKGLPGHIEERERVPGGIWNYRVRKDTIDILKRMFPDADYRPLSLRKVGVKNQIYSLSAMGSLATIAQTAKSDFDIWVCVKKDKIKESQLDGFNEKLHALEEWAEEYSDFESHFFITDIDNVRVNNFGSADKESAGSALGKLLKEEFYRTHTVLAGHFPFWSLMPPNISDEEYERLRTLAIKSYKIERGNYIDMGNSQRVTMEEAFGAALWQLNKALGSPFKSAMKMALIEDYMDQASDPVLLCDRLKDNLTDIQKRTEEEKRKPKEEEEEDNRTRGTKEQTPAEETMVLIEEDPERTNIDGYNLMFNRIQDYYKRKNESEHLEVLRKCFYLKAGTSITGIQDLTRDRYPLKDMLCQIAQSWGWTNDEIIDLNNYEKWPFDKRVALGKQVNNFIIDSYKRLRKSGAESKVQINQTDMTVLGRKLFTFFSNKPNKIGYLPKSFEDSLRQDRITFVFDKPAKKAGLWKVYPGSITPTDLEEGKYEDQVLQRSYNIPEILMWLVVNGIWAKDTNTTLIARESPFSAAEVQDLLFFMTDFFPHLKVDALKNEDLLADSQAERVLAILNYGAGENVNKVARLEVIHSTSWGELFYERAPAKISPAEAVQFCLRHLPRVAKGSTEPPLDRIKVYVPSARAGQSSSVRIFQSFEQVIHKSARSRYEAAAQQAPKAQARPQAKAAAPKPKAAPPKAQAAPSAPQAPANAGPKAPAPSAS
ncbi:class I adenylate cyclase [Nitrospinota bacterium]